MFNPIYVNPINPDDDFVHLIARDYVMPVLETIPEETKAQALAATRHDPSKSLSEWEASWVDPIVRRLQPLLDYVSPPVHHLPQSQINGNQGSATNTDDHASKNTTLKKMKQELKKDVTKALSVIHNPPKGASKQRNQEQKQLPIVSAPVSAIRGFRNRMPRFKRTSQDAQTIWHTELVSFVTGSSAFSVFSLPIQPGLQSSMPWLSTQVAGWEKYRFRKLTAHYETRTGTSTAGAIMMAADYDAADPAPTTEIAMSNYHGMSDDAAWKESHMTFDMNRSKELYLRTGPLALNLDIKTYDFANLFIATADGAVTTWGKIFLEYEIELYNTQVLPTANQVGGGIVGSGAATAANPFGVAVISNGTFINSVTAGGTFSTISLINMTIGNEYQVFMTIQGTGLTAVTSATVSGFTVRTNYLNDLVNAAGTMVTDVFFVTATANTGVITVAGVGTTFTSTLNVFTFTPLVATF